MLSKIRLQHRWRTSPVVFNPSISMSEFKPGQFIRGTSARQRVSITRGFWMGTHEVTQREFESVMGSTPSFFKGETLPVDKVSFEQAVAFCKALTTGDRKEGRIATNMIYRLPTEAEWEYACLAGATTAFSFWRLGGGRRRSRLVRRECRRQNQPGGPEKAECQWLV